MRSVVALALALLAVAAEAAMPRPVARAFLDQGIPLTHVAVVVQRADHPRALFSHQPGKPMNPASTMKLVTTLAALEILGPDYRWKTEAYAGGPIVDGTLRGPLIIKGGGDPKITIEQWQALVGALRAAGIARIDGDLVLDRSAFRLPPFDPAAFDGEPLKPYNVGPDALLVNFKAVRFTFAPNAAADGVDVRVEPPLPGVSVVGMPLLVPGDCGDWRSALAATWVDDGARATATFAGAYPAACGERDWYVALLDAPHYAHAMFTAYFRAAGGTFDGAVRDGRVPAGAKPLAAIESPPLWDVVRDVNKLSNNVMARQVFLTLGMKGAPPPASPERSAQAVRRWLAAKKIRIPGLELENGSGLSRRERVTVGGLAALLASADRGPLRDEYATSLAVAATDGTLERRFRDRTVAGQALMKTGSLEGVRAIAGYVIDAENRRWIVVSIVNHPNAARAQLPMDLLVQWVYANASAWDALHD